MSCYISVDNSFTLLEELRNLKLSLIETMGKITNIEQMITDSTSTVRNTELRGSHNPKKKPKKKLKIIEVPKKKLRIIESKDLEEFDNDFQYFVYMCDQLGYKYYKYSTSCLWIGPALIFNKNKYSSTKLNSIKKKFDISLNTDILENNNIAIYPQKKFDYSTISYSRNYNVKEQDTELNLKEWTCKGYSVYLDTDNYVYDIDTMYKLGIRVYSNETHDWDIINNNYI